MAEEFIGDRAGLVEWVREQVRSETESDDMTPCVKRFLRRHLDAAAIARLVRVEG